MSTIYLIRHGQASFGAADYDRLSPLGRRQADVTGQYFKACAISWDAVYCGDLKRQVDTALIASSHQQVELNPIVDTRFNEIRNDEQVERLVPELLKTNQALAALVDRGLKSSKDYQKVIDAVFNYWVSDAYEDRSIQSWQDYSSGVRSAVKEVMTSQGSAKPLPYLPPEAPSPRLLPRPWDCQASRRMRFMSRSSTARSRDCSTTQKGRFRCRISTTTRFWISWGGSAMSSW